MGLLKTAAIGDTTLLSAVVRDIAATPSVELVLFVGRDNAGVAELIEGPRSVVTLPVTRPWAGARLLRRHQLDLLIDCGAWPRVDAVLTALSGARTTAGFRTAGQGRHFAYDVAVQHRGDLHELENYRRLVAAAGFRTRHAPALRVPPLAHPDWLPPQPYAVCHLWPGGTGSVHREWPLDRWRALIERIVADGTNVVLTGGLSDVHRAREAHASLAHLGARVVNAAGALSLVSLAGVLRRSRLVVSVNTGVMHVAAVLGAPTISLDGPTDSARWGPVGARARSVRSSLPGCGYLDLGWEYDGQRTDCMQGIAVEDVLQAATELLRDLDNT